MKAVNNTVIAAASASALIWVTLYAISTNAFAQRSTYVGILCGIALVSAAWGYGAWRQRTNDRG